MRVVHTGGGETSNGHKKKARAMHDEKLRSLMKTDIGLSEREQKSVAPDCVEGALDLTI